MSFRKVVYVLLILLVLMLIGLIVLLERSGYFKMIEVEREMRGYSSDERSKYLSEFEYLKNEYTVGGIYAGYSPFDASRIYLWTNSGRLISKTLDDASTMRSFTICTSDNISALKNKSKVDTYTKIVKGYRKWITSVKPGTYIRIVTAGVDNQGTVGNVRELHAFDWWVFMPMNMKKMCEDL